jgi:hypothetical protein
MKPKFHDRSYFIQCDIGLLLKGPKKCDFCSFGNTTSLVAAPLPCAGPLALWGQHRAPIHPHPLLSFILASHPNRINGVRSHKFQILLHSGAAKWPFFSFQGISPTRSWTLSELNYSHYSKVVAATPQVPCLHMTALPCDALSLITPSACFTIHTMYKDQAKQCPLHGMWQT